MKNKKEKTELRYGMTGMSLPTILERVNQEFLKKKAELEKIEALTKKELTTAIEKEEEITGLINEATQIKEKMEDEYLSLEKKVASEKRKLAEKDVILEADVRSGKASLKDFMTKGKRDSEILNETIEKTAAELERGMEAIHNKAIEILELQLSLGNVRNTARGLILRGGHSMIELLTTLKDFTEEQTGAFQVDMHNFRSEAKETMSKLTLIKSRVSQSPGHSWEARSPEEAKKIIFDPIIPLDLVPQLKAGLEQYKDAEKVTIRYFWKSKEVDLTPFPLSIRQPRKAMTTGEVEEVKSDKIKRDKK